MKFSILLAPLIAGAVAVAADIIRPQPYVQWPVGTYQEVEIVGDYREGDTVAIFFDNDRSTTLAGGPALQHKFTIQVPKGAVSPPGGYSELLIVHRHNYYLQDVESVRVNVTECRR